MFKLIHIVFLFEMLVIAKGMAPLKFLALLYGVKVLPFWRKLRKSEKIFIIIKLSAIIVHSFYNFLIGVSFLQTLYIFCQLTLPIFMMVWIIRLSVYSTRETVNRLKSVLYVSLFSMFLVLIDGTIGIYNLVPTENVYQATRAFEDGAKRGNSFVVSTSVFVVFFYMQLLLMLLTKLESGLTIRRYYWLSSFVFLCMLASNSRAVQILAMCQFFGVFGTFLLRKSFYRFLLPAAFLLGIILLAAYDNFANILDFSKYQGLGDETGQGNSTRFLKWLAGLQQFSEFRIFGVGLGSTNGVFAKSNQNAISYESAVYEMYYEAGLIGVVLVLSQVWALLFYRVVSTNALLCVYLPSVLVTVNFLVSPCFHGYLQQLSMNIFIGLVFLDRRMRKRTSC